MPTTLPVSRNFLPGTDEKLFQSSNTNVSEHIKKIFIDGEFDEASAVIEIEDMHCISIQTVKET